MGENGRLIAIVVFFVLALAGVWWLTGGARDAPPVEDSVAVAPGASAPAPADEPAFEDYAPVEEGKAAQEDAGPTFEGGTATASAPAAKEKTEREGSGDIHVTVVDEGGSPASGAMLLLELVDWDAHEEPGDDLLQAEGQTDGAGKYTFADMPYGSYVVRGLSATGMQSATAYLSANQQKDDVSLELWASEPTSGRVTDYNGNGIDDAVVYVYETERYAGQILTNSRSTQSRVYTDAEGRFEFPMLWDGRWKFYAKADGYASAITGWIHAGSNNIVIMLGQGGMVSGTVLDLHTNDPVPSVDVRVLSNFGRDHFVGTSDEEGAFSVDNIRTGTYKLTVEDDELVPADDPIEVYVEEGEEVAKMELFVTQGAVITGRIYEKSTGAGYGGAEIGAYGQTEGASRRTDIMTDSQGNYEVRGLSKAVYEVRPQQIPGVNNNQMWELTQQVAVEPGRTYDGIDFVIERGLAVSGIVIGPDERPVSGARISGQARNTYANMTTEDDGRWELTGFSAAQEVTLQAEAEGLAPDPIEPITMADVDVKNIRIEMTDEATVEGRIVDQDGRPYVGAVVRGNLDSPGAARRHASSEATADGGFRIDGMAAGTWQLYPLPSDNMGWGSGPSETIELAAGEHLKGLELEIQRAEMFSIRGRVINTSGEPIVGVQLFGYGGQGGQIQGVSDADGDFTLLGVPAGTYQLTASHGDYTRHMLQVTAGEDNVEIVMSGHASISGRVLSAANGQPIERFSMLLFEGQPENLSPYSERESRLMADPDGEFTLDEVETRDQTLRVMAEGYAKTYVPLTGLVEGEERTGLEVRLQLGATVEGIVVSSAGDPVAGARIFEDVLPDTWRREDGGIATTDGEGRFVAESISPETTVLHAFHKDYVPGQTGLTVSGGGTRQVEIVLPAGGVIEGHVRVGGQPANAYVNVTSNRDGQNDQRHGPVDADGYYRFSGVPEGDVTVHANIQNAQRSRNTQATAYDGMTTTVDIDFPPASAAIEGYITLNGAPITQGNVQLHVSDGTGTERSWMQLQGDGHYLFQNVLEGNATLQVYGAVAGEQQNRQRRVAVQLVANQVTRRDVDLGGGQRIAGRVAGVPAGYQANVMLVSAGVDLAAIDFRDQVALSELYQCCFVANTTVGADGTFLLEGVEPGSYGVIASAADQELARTDRDAYFASIRYTHGALDVTEGQPAEIELVLP